MITQRSFIDSHELFWDAGIYTRQNQVRFKAGKLLNRATPRTVSCSWSYRTLYVTCLYRATLGSRNIKAWIQHNSWAPSYAEWLTEQAHFSIHTSPMLFSFSRAMEFSPRYAGSFFTAQINQHEMNGIRFVWGTHILIVQRRSVS